MKHLTRLSMVTLLVTHFLGCASSGVKNENLATSSAQSTPSLVSESPATVRRLIAKDIEDDMAQRGSPIKITVSGRDNTILTIESAENTRATVANLVHDAKSNARWREMGFERVVFTNGKDEWGLDLK